MEQQTGSKYKKEYVKAVYRHPADLTYMCSGERNGNPLQDSCRENPMDREAFRAAVRRVAELDTT